MMSKAERILLIDDDPLLRRSLVRALLRAGFQAEAADSGRSGLERLSNAPVPDIVLLDYYLPDQSGHQVLCQIRKLFPTLIVVVLSGVSTEAEHAKALSSGANAFLPKTDLNRVLVPLLRDLIAKRNAGVISSQPPSHDPKRPGAAKRDQIRHPLAMPVRVKIAPWDEFAVLDTGNISRGGLFIRMSDPPPVGTPARVRLGLPNGELLELDAEVVHVVAPERAATVGMRAGVGIRFVNWTADERTMVVGLMRKARKQTQASIPRTEFQSVPPPADPAAAPEPAPNELLSQLKAQLADFREQDYFTALSVARDATPTEVRLSFLDLVKKWHPNRFGMEAIEIRAIVAEIFIVLRRAHDTLIDPATSAAYLSRIGKGATPVATDTPPPSSVSDPQYAIQSGPVSASRVAALSEAEAFMARGDFASAKLAYERALARDPKSSRLKCLVALASAHDARARSQPIEAIQHLEAALLLAPDFREGVELLRTLKNDMRKQRQEYFQKRFGE